MTLQPRPEKPAEYDRRKLAPYDFELSCDIKECDRHGTQGVRCKACSTVLMVMCGAHAGRAERQLRESTRRTACNACGTPIGERAALIEIRPLAGWF